jgi:hypothetical protein
MQLTQKPQQKPDLIVRALAKCITLKENIMKDEYSRANAAVKFGIGFSAVGIYSTYIAKEGFLRAYGHDIAVTAVIPMAYFTARKVLSLNKGKDYKVSNKANIAACAAIFSFASFTEYIQAVTGHGTYDPLDFLMYGIGAGIAYKFNKTFLVDKK